MNVLALFDTAGYIVGPAIMLAGLLALLLCLRATRQIDSPQARRTALLASFLPLGAGFLGALFGLIWFLCFGPQGGIQMVQWQALGKVCLAGLVVTTFPLLWSLVLFRIPRTSV